MLQLFWNQVVLQFTSFQGQWVPNRKIQCVDIVTLQIQIPAFFEDWTERFIQKMFVKASHRSQSSLQPLDLHGGLLRSCSAPLASRLWDSSLYCFHSAYLWCILNFVSHTHTLFFLPLSWVISQSTPALLDEGQKHDCYEKPPTS